MNETTKLGLVQEGETNFFIYKNQRNRKKGPGKKQGFPFYNPSMELNRDLSVIFCQWMLDNTKKKLHFLDGLAGTGARSLRIKNEIPGDFNLAINDWSKQSYNLICRNVKHLDLEDVEVLNQDLNVLTSRHRFDYIDVDPFGSPVYFIDSALRGIRHNGVIAVTATDTATLCGVYPKVCLRRYHATPLHSTVMKEVALRILIGFIGREAAKYDLGIKPIVSHATDHYFRVYIQIKNGVRFANDTVENIKQVNGKKISLFDNVKNDLEVGPLWLGKIGDKKIIENMVNILLKKQLGSKNDLWKLLNLLENDVECPAFFYKTDKISSVLKTTCPSMKILFDKIRKKGYNVCKTHFCETGFKTDAPRDEIVSVFKSL